MFLLFIAILHNLCVRYEQKAIYTRAGSVLIAINPYEEISDLYSKEFMTSMESSYKFCNIVTNLFFHFAN